MAIETNPSAELSGKGAVDVPSNCGKKVPERKGKSCDAQTDPPSRDSFQAWLKPAAEKELLERAHHQQPNREGNRYLQTPQRRQRSALPKENIGVYRPHHASHKSPDQGRCKVASRETQSAPTACNRGPDERECDAIRPDCVISAGSVFGA